MLRKIADWRFLKGLDDDEPNKMFEEYFLIGKFKKLSMYEWANSEGSEGSMPTRIVDKREFFAGRESEQA